MEQVRIRACTANDIDGVIALERQWEQDDIAYGDFNMNKQLQRGQVGKAATVEQKRVDELVELLPQHVRRFRLS